MRTETDSRVEISFECGLGATGLKRSEVPGFKYLKVEILSASVSKTATGTVVVPIGFNALCFNSQGALLMRDSADGSLTVVPPRSATFIRGGARLIVQAARGDHSAQLTTWQAAFTPLLEGWIAGRAGGRQMPVRRTLGSKPIDPHLTGAMRRFEQAKVGGDAAEPLLASVVYELVARLMTGSDQVQLAAIPLDLPDTIQALTVEVRKNPALPWPLKEAADAAGYSPFHFSRVFKSLVGYGFHEYVDRCRTEVAIDLLCNSDSPVDLVASTCGFGTTQGLRESVKEYLGLVPSELRAVPETYGIRME